MLPAAPVTATRIGFFIALPSLMVLPQLHANAPHPYGLPPWTILEVCRMLRFIVDNRKRALIAIILVGMAPTVSVLISFAPSGGTLSQVAFILSKFWLFGLHLLWYLRVDGGEISWSKPMIGGYRMAEHTPCPHAGAGEGVAASDNLGAF